jgi:predicted DNA-binding protein with PD1-like motif
MNARLLHEVDGLKTWLLVFEQGDEALRTLEAFARDHALSGSHFTGIGAFERATLGYFDWQRRDYDRIAVDEQVEVLTLAGDVATEDGQPKIHAHVVLGRRDGTALGGHLLAGHVRPTLELTVTDTPAWIRRRHDAASGLALIDLRAQRAQGTSR